MDGRELLSLLLPVIWLVASTVVGLILYKSSSALFEKSSEKTKDGKTKKSRIRLVGSVVIAAGAFYLMKSSTPEQRLTGISPNSTAVPSDWLRSVKSTSETVSRLSLEVNACVEVGDLGDCRRAAQELLVQTKELESLTLRTNQAE